MGLDGNVLITGGAGFLGRGILRRAQREGWSAKFTVLSRDETKQHRCAERYPEARYVLGDVTDVQRLAWVMLGHDSVIHAAALKYIPEGEFNADECVRVNIDGARAVIEAARVAGITRVVGISTDKAAQPVNIYGMTKAVMERLFSEAGFNTCRYGNVVGSTGSVVDVMMRQFLAKGFASITDPSMTRFWMSVDDAVDTIVRTFDATKGSVTVPTPKAASMLAMAYAIIGASGEGMYWDDADGEDSRIKIIGKRPGEKQHEDLITRYEMFRAHFDDPFWEILPPGSEHYDNSHEAISSQHGIYVSREDLRGMILDAKDV